MSGELQRTVGRNLRAYRQRRGVSQESLGLAMGKHRTYIGGVERGERNLSLQTLEVFAETLGLDPLLLLQDTEPDLLWPGTVVEVDG